MGIRPCGPFADKKDFTPPFGGLRHPPIQALILKTAFAVNLKVAFLTQALAWHFLLHATPNNARETSSAFLEFFNMALGQDMYSLPQILKGPMAFRARCGY